MNDRTTTDQVPVTKGGRGATEPNAAEERVSGVQFTIPADVARDRRDIGPRALLAQITGELLVVRTHPAFDDFYRANRAPIGRALALTLRDSDLASEAVDEAMARAFQRWAHVRTLDNPGGWVYRVGLNWSRSFLRRARRTPPTWWTDPTAAPGPLVMDPAIDRALAELSVDQRAVVVCRFLVGYSESQTAAALGLRPGTVKSRLSRALDRLRVLLDGLQLDEPIGPTVRTDRAARTGRTDGLDPAGSTDRTARAIDVERGSDLGPDPLIGPHPKQADR